MGPPSYKAVLFDLGGVLVTDIWEPMKEWLSARYGLNPPDLNAFGKEVVWNDEFACKPDHQDERVLYDRLIDRFGIPATPADLAARVKTFVRPIPGMMDLVRELKGRGLTIGICSNNNEFWYARQRDALDLERIVDRSRIVLSCRVGAKKPRPEIVREAVSKTGVDPAACVFVDDRPNNVLAAVDQRLAGIPFPEFKDPLGGSRYLRRLFEGLGVLPSGS